MINPVSNATIKRHETNIKCRAKIPLQEGRSTPLARWTITSSCGRACARLEWKKDAVTLPPPAQANVEKQLATAANHPERYQTKAHESDCRRFRNGICAAKLHLRKKLSRKARIARGG